MKKKKLLSIKVSEIERDVLKKKAERHLTDVSKLLLKPHQKDFDKEIKRIIKES